MPSPYIIAISGPTSAGKTYFAKLLTEKCVEYGISVSRVSTDDFYIDRSHMPLEERRKQNYDTPNSIDSNEFAATLHNLIAGEAVQLRKYDFSIHNRVDELKTISPADLIIVEGIFALTFPAIRELYSLTIYVNLDSDLRVIRRLERDVQERGRSIESIISQYLNTIRPTQSEYVLHDDLYADIILHGDRDHSHIIDLILSFVSRNQ